MSDLLTSALASIIPGLDVQGFDEYMNLVLDEAEEVSLKRKSRKPLGQLPCYMYMPCRDCLLLCQYAKTVVTICAQNAGRILLKGDNITLMQTT